MKKLILPLLTMAMAFLVLPGAANARVATLNSITPEAVDISDLMDDDAPDGVEMFLFDGTIGETYTAVFSVDEQPAMVVIVGGDLDSRTYDADAGTMTVVVDHSGFVEGAADFGDYTPFGIAIVWVSSIGGEDGPTEEMIGGWMATDILNWELIPPTEDARYFGYELAGPEGTTGFFRMFIPDAVINVLEVDDINDLAVFLDDDQASMSVTEVDGGAEVNINVTFTENATKVSTLRRNDNSGITKSIKVGQQETISFACKSYKKSRSENFTCFGWIKNGAKGEKVRILRKILGQKTWKQHKVTTIKNNEGYFTARLQMKKDTASYKAYHVKSKNYSPVKKVRINK